MRKFFTSFLLVQVFFCLYLNAQTTDVLRDELNNIFQHIDKSQIPTGYLDEYGPGFVPLSSFNGQLSDSNRFDFDSWQIVYGQIRASKIYGSTGLPNLSTAISSVKAAGNHTSGLFAVPLLLMDYSVLNPYAVQQNLFTISNNQVYDVAGRPQSPYQQKLLFGATPAVNYTNTGTVQVLFKPDLFFTNTNKTISSIQVDFNDQNGYITVPLNTAFTKTYTDTGYKRWKIKLTCTDNSMYQCYSEFYVSSIVTNNIGLRYETPPDFDTVFNAISGPGPWAHSGGKISIRYSRKDSERKLNKPFIIVEGYDASKVAPSIKDPLSFKQILEFMDKPVLPYDFLSALDDTAGYDLVFLDFENGTDNLQRNAALFEQVLGWVNQTKAGNPNPQDNVVLGLSMGGMITRYALANLTKQNIPTGTRLLISHDSPHQGANTPLGLQYMTRFLASRGGIGGFVLNELEIVKQGNELLDEPASGELLIYKATSPTTYTANTFLSPNSTYRNMVDFKQGDPTPSYKFIAIASGSECGVPLFPAGSDIVNVQAGVLLPIFLFSGVLLKFEAVVKALPASGSPANIAHLKIYRNISLFFGAIQKVKVLEDFNAFSPAGALPWDGAPGGTVDVAEKLKVKPFKIIIPLGIALTGAGFSLQEKICFVPITSSLDITNVNAAALTAKYVSGISPGNPSRAANFKAQEQFPENQVTKYNTGHRFFTAKNANWLFNEMEGITPNDLNCSSHCEPGLAIIGNDFLCTSNLYRFDQLPQGGTIAWSVSNTSLATLSSVNSNPVTIIPAVGQRGYITLTANVNFCNQSFTRLKQVFVGTPEAPIIGPSNYDAQCGTFAEAYSTAPTGTTGHVWNLNYGQTIQDMNGYGSNYFYIAPFVNTPQQGQTYYNYLTVQAKNACGLSDPSPTVSMTVGPVPNCDGGGGGPIMLRISPNPAGSSANVEALENTYFIKLRIVDRFGNMKKEWSYPPNSRRALINLNNLSEGVYFLKAFDGTTWRTISFIRQ